MFLICSAHGKSCLKLLEMGQEDCVPTNPELADILDDADVLLNNLRFLDVLDSKFADFQVPKF